MPAAVMCTGLAGGALLAAAGLALWGGLRRVPGLATAVRVIRWLAGALLAVGVLLVWQGDRSLSAPGLHLILMAALAAPPDIHGHHLSRRSDVWLVLPALALAGAGLVWAPWPAGPGVRSPRAALVELAVIICGGLGARALGAALSAIAASTSHVRWPFVAVYALLTLLVGGTALVNLWQRGLAWGGTTGERGLAGAWLSWSAAWVSPRHFARLRAVLIVVAASFLIVVAAGC